MCHPWPGGREELKQSCLEQAYSEEALQAGFEQGNVEVCWRVAPKLGSEGKIHVMLDLFWIAEALTRGSIKVSPSWGARHEKEQVFQERSLGNKKLDAYGSGRLPLV